MRDYVSAKKICVLAKVSAELVNDDLVSLLQFC